MNSAAAAAGAGIKAIARLGKGERPNLPLPITPAPPTPWNKTITGHRRFAMRTASLPNIKRLKDATGGTVNDIVMAICAGALREYLLAHDALPDRPLRAMVPASIRTGEEDDPWTNRVSALVVDLPTDCEDPLERVARCRAAMLDAKRLLDLVPADELVDMTQFSAPVLATSAVRLASRLRLADRVAQPFNLVISNVPGPRQPLYLAGAQLCHQFPVSIVTDGQGLNITVASYLDRLDFGFIVDHVEPPHPLERRIVGAAGRLGFADRPDTPRAVAGADPAGGIDGDLLAVDPQLAAPGAHLSETLRVERDSVAAPHDVWLFLHDVEQAIPRQVRRRRLRFRRARCAVCAAARSPRRGNCQHAG